MAKALFTQGVCILLERTASLDEMEPALTSFDVCGRRDPLDCWAMGGPSLLLPYRPDKNGYVTVDTVDQVWPDHMGDPEVEPMLLAAWSMGNFGPFAFPGGLTRAGQQCRAWAPGNTIAEQHRAFIRVRASYVFGAEDDDAVMPADYQALPELEFVTKVTSALLDLPGALCYFNPNGEVLRDRDGFRESLNYAWSNELPALDVLSNVRMFNVNNDWSLMDSVGNGQLDIPDVEACFHSDSYDGGQVYLFIRTVSLYIFQNGEVIAEGDTMDGPGDIRWQARHFEQGLCDPPRRVLRWFPMDRRKVPGEILKAGSAA